MGLASFWVFAVGHTLLVDFKQKLNEDMLEISAEQVSRMASDVSAGALNLIPQVEESLDNPARLEMLLERILKQNPGMRSCGISFVENYYPQKGRSYVPYVYRRDSTHIEVVNHAMQKHNYQKDEWFVQGLQAEEGFWSEPFFEANDTTKAPLVAYLHPIRNKQGRAVAVLGADLSIDSLYMKMDAMDEEVFLSGWSGNGDKDRRKERKTRKARWVPYSFLISQNGTFIVHPKKHRIVLDNIESMAKASEDTAAIASVGRRMMAGEKGSYGKEIDMDMAAEVDVEGLNSYVFFTPVKGTGWSMGLVVPYLVIDIMAFIVAGLLVFFILLAVLIVWLVSWYGIRRATKPLKQLTTSANEVAKGNFDTVLPEVKHNDEIRLLRDSFEDMQHSLTKYMEDLKETTASKAAIENELTIAHNIQMAMLPKIFPPYPERKDIDIYGMLTPAKAVGGDLFDFYIRDEKLFFCIGDVSGKGVPASLVMAVTRSLFRNVSSHSSEPGQIATALNKALSEGNETNMFVTFFVGVLNLADGNLLYCNAGHEAPLLVGKGIGVLPCDANLPLGIMSDWSFTQQQVTIYQQTVIFLFTDGLSEAEDADHMQFGEERILAVAEKVLSQQQLQSQTFIDEMADAVNRFVGDAEQSDDLTMLALQYKPNMK
jgi:sigma-B regulation protein RsbU (phosphoserine phosphatase)